MKYIITVSLSGQDEYIRDKVCYIMDQYSTHLHTCYDEKDTHVSYVGQTLSDTMPGVQYLLEYLEVENVSLRKVTPTKLLAYENQPDNPDYNPSRWKKAF